VDGGLGSRRGKGRGRPAAKRAKRRRDSRGGGNGGVGAELQMVLEPNPKWGLLVDVLAEIRQAQDAAEEGREGVSGVSRAFPSWNRPISTEIYLCHACSDHELERRRRRAGS
jgi:hypothetical protein